MQRTKLTEIVKLIVGIETQKVEGGLSNLFPIKETGLNPP